MLIIRKFLLILWLSVCLAACGTSTQTQVVSSGDLPAADTSIETGIDKLNVVTTVSPITNIVYNIGGDRINLSGIVPEGTNSHTFEPAPSDAIKLAQADLIFINGLHLEMPTLELAEANKKDEAEIIILGEQTITPDEYVYDFSFPKEAGVLIPIYGPTLYMLSATLKLPVTPWLNATRPTPTISTRIIRPSRRASRPLTR